MMISNFIHVMSDNIIWDALKQEFIVLSTNEIEFITRNKGKIIDEIIPKKLIEMGIVIDSDTKFDKISELIEQTTDKQIQGLYLITTTNCNLDCDYCLYRSSISGSLSKKSMMSFDIARKAIDKFYNLVENNEKYDGYWQQITFYGGEPLLNKKLLLQAIPYASMKFHDTFTSIVVNTNLTVLDSELIELFKKFNVQLQVSIDGTKYQHDFHRKLFSGEGTYEIVVENIKKLKLSGIDFLPLITANDVNIQYFNKTLFRLVRELELKKFGVNVLISNSYAVNDEYPKRLAREMIKAYDDFGIQACDEDFVSLYDAILGSGYSVCKNECGSTRKITVFPDGQVYACQGFEKMDKNCMGSLDSDFIKCSNWDYWRKRNRFSNEECLNCEVISFCGGGCALGSYNVSGSIYGIDYNRCQYNKEVFKVLSKRKLSAKK